MKMYMFFCIALYSLSFGFNSETKSPYLPIPINIIQKVIHAPFTISHLIVKIAENSSHYLTHSKTIKNVFTLTMAAGALYGLIKLAQKLFQPSHGAVLNKAKTTLLNKKSSYDWIIQSLTQRYGPDFHLHKSRLYPDELPSEFLGTISARLGTDFDIYMRNLNSTINELNREVAQLIKRQEAIGDSTREERSMRSDMGITRVDIETYCATLIKLRDYMNTYQSYLRLLDNVRNARALMESHTALEVAALNGQNLDGENILNALAPYINTYNITVLEKKVTTLEKCFNDIITQTTATGMNGRPFAHDSHNVQEYCTLLRNTVRLIQTHQSYFALFTQIAHTVGTHGNGTSPLSIPGGTLYPRITYIPQLDNDLAELRRRLQATSQYPYITRQADTILTNLNIQRQEIVNSPEYTAELNRKAEVERQAALARQQHTAAENTRYLQQQAIREKQKANDLAALKLKKQTMTQQEFDAALASIESSHRWSSFGDSVEHIIRSW